jgi:hypothetical protein
MTLQVFRPSLFQILMAKWTLEPAVKLSKLHTFSAPPKSFGLLAVLGMLTDMPWHSERDWPGIIAAKGCAFSFALFSCLKSLTSNRTLLNFMAAFSLSGKSDSKEPTKCNGLHSESKQ